MEERLGGRIGVGGSAAVAFAAVNRGARTEVDTTVLGRATTKTYELARRAARSTLPILILGETGTGKELLARAVHDTSPRASAPLRTVNCGALPPSLAESLLFGHVRGAFTGAATARAGLFEQADGGTLFLDEVGELPASAQAALLRVLETKSVQRVGAHDEHKVDVRLIAATHRDLHRLSDAGNFRKDFLHRLNAVTLTLPPLRERRDEIQPLVSSFLRQLAVRDPGLRGQYPYRIHPDALTRLQSHSWPGNVRQLRNAVERAAVLATGDTIGPEDLPDEIRGASRENMMPAADHSVESDLPMKQRLAEFEAGLIRRALDEAEGHRTRAAELLKMPLRTFMKRLKQYEIK